MKTSLTGSSGGTPLASAVRTRVAWRASVPDPASKGRLSWKKASASTRSGTTAAAVTANTSGRSRVEETAETRSSSRLRVLTCH